MEKSRIREVPTPSNENVHHQTICSLVTNYKVRAKHRVLYTI